MSSALCCAWVLHVPAGSKANGLLTPEGPHRAGVDMQLSGEQCKGLNDATNVSAMATQDISCGTPGFPKEVANERASLHAEKNRRDAQLTHSI